jgi:DNA-binding LytR/AlgR family response regulator
MAPDLLIARSELLPAGWPLQEQPDCFSPVVIRLRSGSDWSGGSTRSNFILLPANPLAIQHVLNQAVRDIYDRKAKQLLYLVDRYVAGSQANLAYRPVIKVEREGRQFELEVGQIVSVIAARKYVLIRSVVGEFTLREPIRSLADKLDPRIFLRIHRSIIVNRRYVDSTLLSTPSASFVTLSDGSRYPIGPNYRNVVVETLKVETLRSSSLSPKIV